MHFVTDKMSFIQLLTVIAVLTFLYFYCISCKKLLIKIIQKIMIKQIKYAKR